MKKALSLAIALVLTLGVFCVHVFALEATPTASTVLVNGQAMVFDAYNINGYNYFKLRDIAYSLNGTTRQLKVDWDDTKNVVTLATGFPYTPVGGEMQGTGAGIKNAVPTTSKLIMSSVELQFTAYNIEGSNYLKLRDLASVLNFGVDWDEAGNMIVIDTNKNYMPEKAPPPPNGILGVWELNTPEQRFGEGYYETVTPEERQRIEFRDDGTFLYKSVYVYSEDYRAEFIWTGDYELTEGKYDDYLGYVLKYIKVSNVFETYRYTAPEKKFESDNYENKPTANRTWAYTFEPRFFKSPGSDTEEAVLCLIIDINTKTTPKMKYSADEWTRTVVFAQTSQQPSASKKPEGINPKLLGAWEGHWVGKNYSGFYGYVFNADGTYMLNKGRSVGLTKGFWREDGGILYLTGCYTTSNWAQFYTSYFDWKKTADSTWRIQMGQGGEESEKWTETGTGTESWLKMFAIDAENNEDGTYVLCGYADDLDLIVNMWLPPN